MGSGESFVHNAVQLASYPIFALHETWR